MPRKKIREDGVGYTVRMPFAVRNDLELLARYHYTSINSEILQALREHIEENRELIDSERKRLAELNGCVVRS